jgi:hypothetical protein
LFTIRVVGNFILMLIDVKFVQMEVVCDLDTPISKGYISSFGNPKVEDVVDSNSCHMRWIRPSHDLRNLWGIRGVTMKVLEVPKSPWIK